MAGKLLSRQRIAVCDGLPAVHVPQYCGFDGVDRLGASLRWLHEAVGEAPIKVLSIGAGGMREVGYSGASNGIAHSMASPGSGLWDGMGAQLPSRSQIRLCQTDRT